MTAFQRVIKYLAIALAIFLIFTIVSVIAELGTGIFGFLLHKTNTTIVDTVLITDPITDLDIELKNANLDIKESDTLKVEISNKNIQVDVKDNKLIIKDSTKKRFISSTRETIILSIPESIFNKVIIKNGAGDLNIDTIITDYLDLDLGVGASTVNYLKANESKIKTGVGKMIINDGELNNSNIDIGVGSASIKAILTGDNTIDAGVGATTLLLIGNKDDYKIKFNKGIGSIKYNNENELFHY